jgi:hypothetical protein
MYNEVCKRKVDTWDNLLTRILDTAACAKKHGETQKNDTWSLHMNCKVYWGWCWDFQTFTANSNKSVV